MLADFANGRLALMINGARRAACAVGAGEEKAILADAVDHRTAAFLADVGRSRAAGVFQLFQGRLHIFMEWSVEVLEQLKPIKILLFDLVELQLHLGGEAYLHDVRKALDQFVGDNSPEQR